MSFVAGFTAGLMVGKKKFGGAGSGSGDELWTPPADWLEVPEPGPWEANFLVEFYTEDNNLTLEFRFADPKYNYAGKGTIIIDWGDGNTESFIGGEIGDDGSLTGDTWWQTKHTYEKTEQYVIKVSTDRFTCLLNYFSFDSRKNLLIAKLGENIYLETDGTTSNTNCSGSFSGCNRLRWVSIKGNTKLPNSCFSGCYPLTRLDISNKVSEIPNYCFNNCYALKFRNIDFSNVTKIGNGAFNSCYNLQKISAPLCTSVGDSAFYSCYALETATFADSCTYGSNAFNYCYNLYPRPDGSIN